VDQYNERTKRLVNLLPADSLTAILVKPMMGWRRVLPGHAIIPLLAALATDNQALLIFDEVMTSRLSYHGRSHQMGTTPDLVILSSMSRDFVKSAVIGIDEAMAKGGR
jgi:glutamate-1-semialdehyde 2,1-aminomutase